MTDEQMFNMSDEELERAFLEARAQDSSPETDIETEIGYDDSEETIDLEQPEMDSDNDLVVDDTEDTETEADSKETESTPDEGTEVAEEQTEEDDAETVPEVTETPVHKFKANGKEYTFTPEEMMAQFPKVFGQAMDYTKKTQSLKPWRKTIDAIESANLSHDQINLMIDVFKGDKNAIAEVMRRTGVDALDLDTENNVYTPKDYGRDETALAIKDIVDEISSDKEFNITQQILNKEWDDRSFSELTRDPELIKLLHIDVKSGTYDKVQPIAEKLKVFDRGRKSDLEYYKQAAGEYFREIDEAQRREQAMEEQRQLREAKAARQAELERVRTTQAKQEAVKTQAVARKAAAPTKSNAGTKKSVTDYLDESDEAYDDWYKRNVLDKM